MFYNGSVHRFYDRLIEQISTARKIVKNRETEREKKPKFRASIFISRESGSGGRPIAKLVAKKLKFELLNKSLVEEIAKSANKRKYLISSVDEKSRGIITDIVQSVLNPDYISDMTYIRHLTRVILLRAQKGKVVILGRGGNFMIPADCCLRVRIQAPYSVRVTKAIKYEGIDREKAMERIKKVDAERKDFIRQYFGKNISNANYYDLTLNTTYMSLEDAARIIILAFKRKFQVK